MEVYFCGKDNFENKKETTHMGSLNSKCGGIGISSSRKF